MNNSFASLGMIPLGFVGAPRLTESDGPDLRRLKVLYLLVSVFALISELVSMVWCTVAVNKLSEATSEPASSVVVLLERDYELAWLA